MGSISRAVDPESYTIGYAMEAKRKGSFIQPSFLDAASRRGMRFVAIDMSRPLAEQGPFDIIVHKIYDHAWRAHLEAFSALHPGVPVVDPPAAIDRVLDRFTMLDAVVSGLSHLVSVPKQIVVRDAADLLSDAQIGGLRFPLIAKPEEVDGSAASHDLCLVYRAEGLRGIHTPVVLQEFVNHGGALFKVYVVGGSATCVRRSSLPDVPESRLRDADAPAAVPFAYISNQPLPDKDGGVVEVEMPPAEFVDEVARELRRALGLNLINFDLIRGNDGKYFVLDINYCPAYSKVPGFEQILTDFFWEMLNARNGQEPQV
ncbi:hypothetical protein PR202_gb08474 [Eleusine coracana subsp. coracana]|uniref:Inositol-tetrakisphosphate 1-kinase n=1 Tax=Eleusine coracana subsp. coracana TaxID=191504 RepID=A0AAV5ECB8_ELECO|nr:hypothetical protein QOZ80_2BG0185670 [Eleusine coracana subsp. coracana]GJN21029.1 hypothetical protein PR202_gb08474 [Eleusine coracana subsp. coracana]